MKGFIEIYATDTETYYVNVSQIKYFYVPLFQENGERFITILLGDGKQIRSKLSLEAFKKLSDTAFED